MGSERAQSWGEETKERTKMRENGGSSERQLLPSVLRCPWVLVSGTHNFPSSPEAWSCTSHIPCSFATWKLSTLLPSGQLNCPVAPAIPAISQQPSFLCPPSAGCFTLSVLSRFPYHTSYLATLDQLIHYKASVTNSIPVILKPTPFQNSHKQLWNFLSYCLLDNSAWTG